MPSCATLAKNNTKKHVIIQVNLHVTCNGINEIKA